MKLKHSRPRT